jgi:hypothetical protein
MATTTTNFGFDIPQSSDYVKNGATAIAELGQDIDTRFGNVATYPNQIVNVVSGVSRPIAYATSAGTAAPVFTASTTGTVTVTFAASRFTQAPLISILNVSAAGNLISSTYRALSITSASFQVSGTATAAITQTGAVHWTAVQMTSAASAG